MGVMIGGGSRGAGVLRRRGVVRRSVARGGICWYPAMLRTAGKEMWGAFKKSANMRVVQRSVA
jgi:hypothetical protein